VGGGVDAEIDDEWQVQDMQQARAGLQQMQGATNASGYNECGCATNAEWGCNECEIGCNGCGLSVQRMRRLRGATNANNGVQRMRERVQQMRQRVQRMRERVQRMRQQMRRRVQRMQVRDERDYGSNGCSIGGARIVPRGAACG
jgi:hypothetical protein